MYPYFFFLNDFHAPCFHSSLCCFPPTRFALSSFFLLLLFLLFSEYASFFFFCRIIFVVVRFIFCVSLRSFYVILKSLLRSVFFIPSLHVFFCLLHPSVFANILSYQLRRPRLSQTSHLTAHNFPLPPLHPFPLFPASHILLISLLVHLILPRSSLTSPHSTALPRDPSVNTSRNLS